MGTRSIIAVPTPGGAPGRFRGRYAHWDGYPSWTGAQLHAIVARDGVAAARAMLTETHPGWSTICADPAEAGSVGPDEVEVPGYGVAFTAEAGLSDEWITDAMPGYGSYAYVLGDDAITVLTSESGAWTPLGEVAYANEHVDVQLLAMSR